MLLKKYVEIYKKKKIIFETKKAFPFVDFLNYLWVAKAVYFALVMA